MEPFVVNLPHPRHNSIISSIISPYEPPNYKEVITNPLWQQAMKEELHALEKSHAWDLVQFPPDKTLMDCKWAYKIKTV